MDDAITDLNKKLNTIEPFTFKAVKLYEMLDSKAPSDDDKISAALEVSMVQKSIAGIIRDLRSVTPMAISVDEFPL